MLRRSLTNISDTAPMSKVRRSPHVFDVEPLPLDHPFRRLENIVITPHMGYVTEETYRVFYGHALEDIQAFLKGEPIRVLNS